MWADVLKLIGPAVLSAILSGIWVSRWKANLDHAEKRIDELCSDIYRLADLAADYWSKPQANESPLLEARISSGMMRLAAARVALSTVVSGLDEARLVDLEQHYIRTATGGDFGVHNRQADITVAVAAQYAASSLVLAIRRGRMEALNARWIPRV